MGHKACMRLFIQCIQSHKSTLTTRDLDKTCNEIFFVCVREICNLNAKKLFLTINFICLTINDAFENELKIPVEEEICYKAQIIELQIIMSEDLLKLNHKLILYILYINSI